jgi:hypothetical protein
VWVVFLLLVISGLWIFAIEDLDKIDSRKVPDTRNPKLGTRNPKP